MYIKNKTSPNIHCIFGIIDSEIKWMSKFYEEKTTCFSQVLRGKNHLLLQLKGMYTKSIKKYQIENVILTFNVHTISLTIQLILICMHLSTIYKTFTKQLHTLTS